MRCLLNFIIWLTKVKQQTYSHTDHCVLSHSMPRCRKPEIWQKFKLHGSHAHSPGPIKETFWHMSEMMVHCFVPNSSWLVHHITLMGNKPEVWLHFQTQYFMVMPPSGAEKKLIVCTQVQLRTFLYQTTTTTTTTVLRPFVRDYLGELAPEETFTHSPIMTIIQPLSASSMSYDP